MALILVTPLLQEELIMYIMHKLDIRSLCRLARTCKLLQGYASDPFLYMTLNLRVCNVTFCICIMGKCSLTFVMQASKRM